MFRITAAILAFIQTTYSGMVQRDLRNLWSPTTVAFYDFDKTLVINSTGEDILRLCQKKYSPDCNGRPGELADTLRTLDDPVAMVKAAFGGQSRIDRLFEHFAFVTNKGNQAEYFQYDSSFKNIYILSTSWEEVSKEDWREFIYLALRMVSGDPAIRGFDQFFPYENILTLADPGPGIPADKGAVLQAKLNELGITHLSECIFADDSIGNIKSAEGKCDTLFVQERLGLDETDLNYMEGRAILPIQEKTTPTPTAPTNGPSLRPTTAEPTPAPKPKCTCVTSCDGLPNGSHHNSCKTCNGYVQCGNGIAYEMKCSGNLEWDSNANSCVGSSSTCPLKYCITV